MLKTKDLRRKSDRLLESYEHIGRLEGALKKHADSVYESLEDETKRNIARRMFLDLVQVRKGQNYARRRARKSELLSGVGDGEPPQEVLSTLVDNRLLIAAGHDGGEDDGTIELAHEILTRKWDTLTGWLDSNLELLLWRQRLRPFLQEWQRDKSAVLRGTMLEGARDKLREQGPELTPDERDFIQGSSRRDRALRGTGWAAASALFVALFVTVGWQFWTSSALYQIRQILSDADVLFTTVQSRESGLQWIESLALYGEREKVVSLSEQVVRAVEESGDPALKVRTHARLSVILWRAGSRKKSKQFLSTALSTLPQILPQEERDRALLPVLEARLKMGELDLAGVIRASEEIDSVDSRERALMSAAVEWAKKGDSGEAWRGVVPKIRNPFSALSLFAEIANDFDFTRTEQERAAAQQAVENAIRAALEIAEVRNDPEFRSMTNALVVGALAESGQFDKALNRARQIDSPFYRSRALSEIVATLASADPERDVSSLLADAQELALKVSGQRNRSEAVAVVAAELAGLGRYSQARLLAGQHCLVDDLLSVYARILLEYAEDKKPSAAASSDTYGGSN